MSKPKIKIKLVKQEEECGCAVACLAMITKQDYKTVASHFNQRFEDDGMSNFKEMDYLADFGFQVVTKQVYAYHQKDFYRDELLKPFADVHIISLKPYFGEKMNHSVVMDSEGNIFCPAEKTDINTVYAVDAILGIFK